MGDHVTGVLQKQLRRKFKGLTLSKNERTSDESFEVLVNNFAKQQKNAERLQKELSKYVNCVKATAHSCRSFYESVREVYEPDWDGVEHVKAITQSIDLLWDDFFEKLTDQALNPLISYNNKFPEVRAKIDKRARKLLDYDLARNDLEKTSSATKKDDAKIAKATEKFNETKQLFEEINSELLVELPQLFDDRIPFYAANFQLVFHLEQTFHSETAKLSEEASNRMDKLGETSSRRRSFRGDVNVAAPNSAPRKAIDSTPITKPSASPALEPKAPPKQPKEEPLEAKQKEEPPESRQNLYPAVPPTNGDTSSLNPFDEDSPEVEDKPPPYAETDAKTLPEEKASSKSSAAAPKVLYQVRATHKYTGEDSDELSFEAGEVISVIPYDDADEQDDGWLMGLRESGEKGVFPANFTKEI